MITRLKLLRPIPVPFYFQRVENPPTEHSLVSRYLQLVRVYRTINCNWNQSPLYLYLTSLGMHLWIQIDLNVSVLSFPNFIGHYKSEWEIIPIVVDFMNGNSWSVVIIPLGVTPLASLGNVVQIVINWTARWVYQKYLIYWTSSRPGYDLIAPSIMIDLLYRG